MLNHGDKHSGETLTLSFSLIIKYFIAGVFASSAMLLPGISGSFMLLVFGVYGTLMYAISELLHFNLNALPIILIVGFGIVTGFMISSRLIQYCSTSTPTMTFADNRLCNRIVVCSFPWIPERLNPMDHIIFPIDHWLLSKLCSW